MERIPDGILGTLMGKVGPVSGYRRNGQDIIRTAFNRGSCASTPRRVAQKEKIKVCNDFTKAFSGTGFSIKHFLLIETEVSAITGPRAR